MHGSLAHGDFARLAYRLGREAATGLLTLTEQNPCARHDLFLRRGDLTSARVEGHWAPLGQLLRANGSIDDDQLRRSLESSASSQTLQGHALRAQGISEGVLDAALRRQAELRLERLASITLGTYTLDTSAPPPPAHRSGRPFSLTTWARRHVEAKLDAGRARILRDELGTRRLALRKDLAPEAIDCDDVDRRILAALATPRRIDEIWQATKAPQMRLLGFLLFLNEVGALAGMAPGRPEVPHVAGRAQAEARRVLGVGASADSTMVKQAYRRLARAWHPDMHPEMDAAGRKTLEARFAALAGAYRRLLGGDS